MTSSYELKLENFVGPLEKLLELIEERKMEINEVSLGVVTEDFLKYLRSLSKIDIPFLADFISVASRLVLLKSKSLLGGESLGEDEEEGIKDLEQRLRVYKEFKPAMKILSGLWKDSNWEIGRAYFLLGSSSSLWASSQVSAQVFYPGEKLDLQSLKVSMEKLLFSLGSFSMESQTVREKVVTLEEKIKEIIAKLEVGVKSSFDKIAQARIRSEVIVVFLAILHLAHERLIELEQDGHFSDIMVRKL